MYGENRSSLVVSGEERVWSHSHSKVVQHCYGFRTTYSSGWQNLNGMRFTVRLAHNTVS